MLKHQDTAAQDIGRYGNQAAQLKTTKPQRCGGGRPSGSQAPFVATATLPATATIPATVFFHTHPLHDMLDILI
jgi:hypothetical protein